jgi:hypothetical protein
MKKVPCNKCKRVHWVQATLNISLPCLPCRRKMNKHISAKRDAFAKIYGA